MNTRHDPPMDDLIGDVALVAGGLRVGVNDDVGGEASGRAGLSVVVDGVVVEFLARVSEEGQKRCMSGNNTKTINLQRRRQRDGEREVGNLGGNLQRRGRTSCVRACATHLKAKFALN
jgi:hypothetical protein